MASEMTSAFRDFALKKLSAAKQKGEAGLVNASSTIASISSNVNVATPASAASAAASFATSKIVSIGSISSMPKNSAVEAAASFVFRSRSASSQQPASSAASAAAAAGGDQTRKQDRLREANGALQKSLEDYAEESLRGSINQVDAINESLAFTMENIQEAAHVMRLMTRQMSDLAHLQEELNQTPGFYRRRHESSGSSAASSSSASSSSSSASPSAVCSTAAEASASSSVGQETMVMT